MKSNLNTVKITNPLTIIGMFAGLAEIAGTVVFALITVELQKFYIWYVIGFPTLLIILFFITLNFNSAVLYAPSDFKDEKYFLALRNVAVEIQKLMINKPELATELKPTIDTFKEVVKNPYTTKIDRLPDPEKKIINLLSENLLQATYFDEIKNTTKVDDNELNEILENLINKKIVNYAPGNKTYYLSSDYWN